jgi:hypothetical protein
MMGYVNSKLFEDALSPCAKLMMKTLIEQEQAQEDKDEDIVGENQEFIDT